MKGFGRRAILRALAASPISAHAVAEQIKSQATGIAFTGVGVGRSEGIPASISEPMQFSDFASWFARCGDKAVRREANYVSALDPDLVEMRLPLATKVRMQRQRNYRRVLDERKEWFNETLSVSGIVSWWP